MWKKYDGFIFLFSVSFKIDVDVWQSSYERTRSTSNETTYVNHSNYIERIFLYVFTFLKSLDDGKTKPDQKPEVVKLNKKTHASKVVANKSRSESTSSHHGEPEYMCLIRATFRNEKISTVVSLPIFE